MKRLIVSGLVLVLGLLGACGDDDITKGWLVDRTRVLAARIEAAADPSRSDLVPGEHARLTWLVAAPSGITPKLSFTFAVCAAPPGSYPEPRCEGAVLAGASGAADGEILPMELDTPSIDPGELVVLAAFCEGDGAPVLDALRFEATCPAGAPPLLASVSLHVVGATTEANHNPEIAADAVRVDTSALAEGVVCPPMLLPSADHEARAAGSKHPLGFTFRPQDREAGETLTLSHIVTGGKLARQFSGLEPSEAAPKDIFVDWTLPSAPRTDVFVVLRDGRGGTAFVHRTLCVHL